MIIVFKYNLKFWPSKEDKELPLDENVDYSNPFEVLRHRNKVRLFYLNWVQVWRTYYFFSKWAIGIVPLVYLITNSLWATGIVFAIWLVCRIYSVRKLESILVFKFLASNLIDQFATPYFGPLEPFE